MRAPQPPKPFSIGLPAGFIAGLIVGLLLGWFFHGVVGLFVRLGFALLLLIPLIIIVWFFFLRNRIRSAAPDDDGGMQVYTWSSGRGGRRESFDPRRQAPSEPEPPPARPRDENVIDIEFEELKRQVDDEGTPR